MCLFQSFTKGLAIFLDFTKSPPPKVTKSIFHNISSFLLMLSASKLFLVRQQLIFLWETKIFFDGKPKMKQKFVFEKLKIPNPDIWPFWEIFDFSNSIFLSFLVSDWKNIFFLKQTYFCFTKTKLDDSVNREEDVL